MIRPAIRRAVRGAMKFAMNSNTPRYEQIATGNVVRAMADRVYLDASASGTSDTYNNTHQLAITGGTGLGQSGLVNDYVVDNVTNKVPYSVNFNLWSTIVGTPIITANTWSAPDGSNSGYTIEDDDNTTYEGVQETVTINGLLPYSITIRIKKDTIGRTTRFPAIYLIYLGSTTETNRLSIDTNTGEFNNSGPSILNVTEVIDKNDYWLVHYSVTSNDSNNNLLRVLILPSAGASPVWSVSVAAIGSAQLWGAHIYQGLDLKEYIPTNGIESTETVRVAHVSSDFITIPQGPADSTYAINKILGVP